MEILKAVLTHMKPDPKEMEVSDALEEEFGQVMECSEKTVALNCDPIKLGAWTVRGTT